MTKTEVCEKLRADIITVRGYLDKFDFDIKNLGLEEVRKATIEQSEFIQDKIDEFYMNQTALDIYRQGIDLIYLKFVGAEKAEKLEKIKTSMKKQIKEERAKGIPYFLQEPYE
ncbi:hypothetical protein HON36_04360 [Candidatus Parcubacteria bacterium]|jgi:hypothetical protein|nr:hypothetical protein [Candidatus Parcubacteria bacterium]MBT7228485.1 hypothetical protein [Candidatus Parcubacteria bacterium]